MGSRPSADRRPSTDFNIAIASSNKSTPLYLRMKPKNRMIKESTGMPSCLRASCLSTGDPKLSYKGCSTCLAGFDFSNFCRSSMTFSLIVMKASQLFRKYLVKGTSPALFSCGKILSVIAMIFVCLFFFAFRSMVPRAGPKNGSQYLTTIMSGRNFFSSFPTFIQLRGLIELIVVTIFKSSGAGSLEYCVVPGNKKEGYCNEKE